MKRLITILLSTGFVLSFFSGHGIHAQDPGYNPIPPHGSSRQAKIDFFNNEIKKCNDYLDEVSIKINGAEILLEHEIGKNTYYELGVFLYRERLRIFKYEALEVCVRIEIYQKEIKELPPPTPTPSPSPVTTGSSQTGNEGKGEQNREYESQVKFINDYRTNLNDIKTGTDRTLNEISEYVKKATQYRTADGFTATSTLTGGLSNTIFTTPAGRITFSLPEDIQAGDTITGTVRIEPNGQDEDERRKNGTTLSEYGIDLVVPEPKGQFFTKGTTTVSPTATGTGSTSAPPRWTWTPLRIQPWLTFNVPNTLSKTPTVTLSKPGQTTSIPIVLIHQSLILTLPIKPSGSPDDQGTTRFPSIGQTGRPLEIRGPFDGNAGTTKVNIGGKPVEILAESPRKCVFRSPVDNTGPTEIMVSESGTTTRGTYRNVGIGLSAPNTNLKRGERTTLTVQVTGLAGIRNDVPLQLVKTGTVTMNGGDTQHIRIRRQDVRPDGTFSLTRDITGVQPGGFNVTATVFDPTRRPVVIPLNQGARVNGYEVVTENGKPVLVAGGVIDPLTGKPLDGTHRLQAGCGNPVLSKIPYLSRLFKNGDAKFDKTDCLVFITPRIIVE